MAAQHLLPLLTWFFPALASCHGSVFVASVLLVYSGNLSAQRRRVFSVLDRKPEADNRPDRALRQQADRRQQYVLPPRSKPTTRKFLGSKEGKGRTGRQTKKS